MYIGTPSGLNIYNKGLNEIHSYPFKKQGEKLMNYHYISIKKTNNILWLGTLSNGLFKYDINSGDVEKFVFKDEETTTILKVEPLTDNRLLVVSPSKLTIIDHNLNIIKTHKENENIKSVFISKNGTIYAGLVNGELISYTTLNDEIIVKKRQLIIDNNAILSINEDLDNNIWIGKENGGIYLLELKSKENKIQKLIVDQFSEKSIWSIYKDINGVMWVGTFKHGLYFYNAEYHKFEHIKNNMFNVNSINNNNTNCFFEDNNGIWIGTDGGGLNYWNRNSNTFKSYSSKNNKLHTDIVLSLLNTKKDELWVGSWGNGLAIFNTKTKTYKTLTTENSFLLSNNIIAMVMDREGKIWISSLYGGLQIYDPKNNTHENIDLPYSMKGSSVTNSIINIFIDRKKKCEMEFCCLYLFKGYARRKQLLYQHRYSR